MDRCALFVDAGYVLADGAMAVHGTRHRESVSWNYAGILQFLGNVARDRTGLPLLRCYWYEATVEGRRTQEHDALADLPGVKLRLGRMRPGRREGVESEIHRDLTALARNGAVSDALVVSAEEGLAQVISDVQDLGVRVTIVHITVDGNWTISRALRQECDDIIEIGEAHLRPYVDLVVGAEPFRDDERRAVGAYPGRVLTNGHGPVGALGHQHALPAGSRSAPPEIYTAPVIADYQRAAQPAVNGHPGSLQSADQSGPIGGVMPQRQPGSLPSANDSGPTGGAVQPAQQGGGQSGQPSAIHQSPPVQDVGSPQGMPVMPGVPAPTGMPPQPGMQAGQSAAPGMQAGQPTAPGMQAGQPTAPGSPGAHTQVPQMPQPGAGAPGMAGQPGMQQPAPMHQQQSAPMHQQQSAPMHQQQPAPMPSPPAQPAPHNSAAMRTQSAMQQPSMMQQPPGMQPPPRSGQPVPAGSGGPSGVIGQPGPQPPVPAGPAGASPMQGGPAGSQAGQPAYPAPPPMGYQGTGPDVSGAQGGNGPRPAMAGTQPAPALTGPPGPPMPGHAGPAGPGGPAGPTGQQLHGAVRTYPSAGPTGRFARGPQDQRAQQQFPGAPADPADAGSAYVPQQGPYSGPQPAAQHAPVPQPAAVSLADAVQSAHGEGFNFGQSVARDAPALWLEAVLARKPRMPSDLEARLLQDSALPIDSLLHDEVRHALRRGFWDALERARH